MSETAIFTQLENVQSLPPIPQVAQEILSLIADPLAGPDELAGILAMDPSITAQVMRMARSPLYAYQGRLDTLSQAINNVLGFETVCHLSLALAAGEEFNIPKEGALGLNNYWNHSLHTALLMQRLAPECLPGLRPGLAYLCGLLHNFGYLLMGHLFSAEFNALSRAVGRYPNVSIERMERKLSQRFPTGAVFKAGHEGMGSWLLDRWNLPAEVVLAAGSHHKKTALPPYVQLLQLSQSLLLNVGISLDDPDCDWQHLQNELQLSDLQIHVALASIVEKSPEINELASKLAA